MSISAATGLDDRPFTLATNRGRPMAGVPSATAQD